MHTVAIRAKSRNLICCSPFNHTYSPKYSGVDMRLDQTSNSALEYNLICYTESNCSFKKLTTLIH